MIFDTMKPAFIWLLLIFGSLCITFLLSSVRAGFHSNRQISSNLKAAGYLLLAIVFAAAFIRTTAPSKPYSDFLGIFLWSACAVSTVVWAVTAAAYMRTKKAYFEPVIHFKDLLDDIDDYVFIFDAAGEPVLHNNPKGSEKIFPANVNSLREASALFDAADLTEAFMDAAEHRIEISNRYFVVNSSVIRDKKNTAAGTVLIFHDITKEQLLIDELEAKNILVAQTNEKLFQAIEVDEALLAQEERENLAAEIRLELEAKMNDTIRFIDSLSTAVDENQAQKEQNLRNLAERLRSVLADIRRMVYKTKEL